MTRASETLARHEKASAGNKYTSRFGSGTGLVQGTRALLHVSKAERVGDETANREESKPRLSGQRLDLFNCSVQGGIAEHQRQGFSCEYKI